MLKACLRLFCVGFVLFIAGIIGLAALEINGYDIDDISVPIRGSADTVAIEEKPLDEGYDGAIARYDSDEITKLDINVKAGDFTVIGGESFSIEASGIKSEWLKYEVNNKCLSVSYSPEFNFISFDFMDFDADDANIIITVPHKVFESADFSVSAGELYVDDLEADRLTLDFTAGVSMFSNVTAATSSQIKMTAGDCTFGDCIFNNANIKLSAGEMTYSGCRINGGTKIKMTAGNLYMDIFGRRSDYDITVDRTAGHAYIDGYDMDGGIYAFTTFETVTTVYDAPREVPTDGGEEFDETEISREAVSEKNTIDITLTAGECSINFYEYE